MIGKSISHYRVTEKLGAGGMGMGMVYEAEDASSGSPAARLQVVSLYFPAT